LETKATDEPIIQPVPQYTILQVAEQVQESDQITELEQNSESDQSPQPETIEPGTDTAQDAEIDSELDDQNIEPVIKPLTFAHNSEAIHNKYGLKQGEYLMADIARMLNKNVDNIWRIVEKYNLKAPEFCRRVENKYIYNEKAVDKIIEHLSNAKPKK